MWRKMEVKWMSSLPGIPRRRSEPSSISSILCNSKLCGQFITNRCTHANRRWITTDAIGIKWYWHRITSRKGATLFSLPLQWRTKKGWGQTTDFESMFVFPSVLWQCWLGDRTNRWRREPNGSVRPSSCGKWLLERSWWWQWQQTKHKYKIQSSMCSTF